MIPPSKLVALGGLLHDVGKFRQRAYWSDRRPHEFHGADWVKERVAPRLQFLSDEERRQLVDVVRRHHQGGVYERDLRVVQLADRLASGERVQRQEEGTGDPSRELLLPVFASLSLDGRGLGPQDRSRWAYRTARLKLDGSIFPVERATEKADYPALWRDFEKAWLGLPDGAPAWEDPDAFALTWLSLLRVFAWSVPAAAYKDEPDVSLADHLQVTGALAACLWELPDPTLDRVYADPAVDEPVALLVGGDVSGIQRFLYTISSAGAAKSLRGRSAYLSLLCDALAEHVRRKLELLPCNVLYSGGGHFYLVAPLSARRRLEELCRKLTELLLDFFGGDVSVVLEAVQLQASDLSVAPTESTSPLGQRWRELSDRLRAAKQLLLRDAAQQDPARVFGPFGVGGREDYCVVCHSEPDQPDGLKRRGLHRPVKSEEPEEAERKCSLCESFEELARRVGRARYLVVRAVPPRATGKLEWHSVLTALGLELWLNNEGELLDHHRDGDWVVRLNDPDLGPVVRDGRTVPVTGFRFLPNFTPGEQGHVREIADMARSSQGAPYFGSLRADVDSLGRLFSEGLGGRLSLSRVATLSRSLGTFFEGYLNRVCEDLDPRRERLYLLYSGGDDLLAVGSWDAVVELAQEVRSKFRDYVCGNPCVTLSAATALHHEKFPLYQAAEDAGSLLEAAKGWRRDGREKDALNFWGQAVEWDDVDWARRWHDTLCSWLADEGKVRRAFVFKLARIAALYEARARELARRGDLSEAQLRLRVRYDRWLWTLVYYLAKEREELRQELEQLRAELVDQDRIRHLGLLARWVELSTR